MPKDKPFAKPAQPSQTPSALVIAACLLIAVTMPFVRALARGDNEVTAAASYAMTFIAAMTGWIPAVSTRAATYVIGFPCSRSPASTSTTRPGLAPRTESTIVAARERPRMGSATSPK